MGLVSSKELPAFNTTCCDDAPAGCCSFNAWQLPLYCSMNCLGTFGLVRGVAKREAGLAAAGGASLLPPGGAAATLRCTFLGKRAPRGDVMACCMAALVPLACCCCCCLKGWLSCCDVIGSGIVTCDVADLLGVTCADILGGGPLMRRRTLCSDMRICS